MNLQQWLGRSSAHGLVGDNGVAHSTVVSGNLSSLTFTQTEGIDALSVKCRLHRGVQWGLALERIWGSVGCVSETLPFSRETSTDMCGTLLSASFPVANVDRRAFSASLTRS